MHFFEERIGQILQLLKDLVTTDVVKVEHYQMLNQTVSKRLPQPPGNGEWLEYTPDASPWDGDDCYAWFKTQVTISPSMDGKPVYFALETGRLGWDALNPQFTVYVDGELRQGLDVNHRDVLLTDNAQAGQIFTIMLSAYSGVGQGDLRLRGTLFSVDKETLALYFDMKTPLEIANLLEKESDEYILIVKALNEAVNQLDMRVPGSQAFLESVSGARAWLKEHFYNTVGGDKNPQIWCVGHTHIDVAWMWPLRVTEDKAVRSFSTVLQYLKEYPDYTFMSSQPQLYQYVKDNAPEVYEGIKQAVQDGRWEPEGAMFVEADCNLASGEALVRQILHGKQFFRREFGRDNEVVWLPDVFGYSAALPQIFQLSGIKYFMTTKISWNEFNRLPYDTFNWQGIDGSRVLTHFSPSRDYDMTVRRGQWASPHFTTYNATLSPNHVMGAWKRYQQKDLSTIALMSFGHGDGGGGPTRDMLEHHKRLRVGLPGSPQTKMADTRTFFRELERQVSGSWRLPTWSGELYFEYHRGTLTSMARNKRDNRRSEFGYQNSELFGVMAEEWMEQRYPKQRLLKGWEAIERNQFHDILPGSSIKEVYDDSAKEYAWLHNESESMLSDSLNAMAQGIAGDAGDLIVFNPLHFQYNGCVRAGLFPQGTRVVDGDRPLPTQQSKDGQLTFTGGAIPAKGYKRFRIGNVVEQTRTAEIDGLAFETPYYRLRFSENMEIESLWDKQAERQVLTAGQTGNQLMTYEDRPHQHDAWDINNYYTEHAWPLNQLDSYSVLENGPVRCVVEIKRSYLQSSITQRVILYREDRRIDFENDWDWKQSHILARVLFPVDIIAQEATYEIQFGHVQRPTHFNTSWDVARFEVCHHKWLDVSESGYGVSLLNDSKYGASVHEGVIGLSLVKSATYPNPVADQERHQFTYSLLPHLGTWQEAGVLDAGYALNNPPRGIRKDNVGGHMPSEQSFVSCDAPNVIIDTVKQAEESEATIVRLYEAWRGRANATLRFAQPIDRVSVCNLMEENDQPFEHTEHTVTVPMNPFEIKTLKVFFSTP